MAVSALPKDSVLVVIYQDGIDSQGNPVLRQRSFSNVKAEAADQDVYAVAQAMFSLQQFPVHAIRRDNRLELIDNGN